MFCQVFARGVVLILMARMRNEGDFMRFMRFIQHTGGLSLDSVLCSWCLYWPVQPEGFYAI